MGVVFALRGNSLTPYYCGGSGDVAAIGTSANRPIVDTGQAGINGTSSINFARNGFQNRFLAYHGYKNMVDANTGISFLMRIYFNSVSNNTGLFKCGIGGRFPRFGFGALIPSIDQTRFYVWDQDTTQDAIFSQTDMLTGETGKWLDIGFSYEPTPTIPDGNKIYKGATLNNSQSSTRTLPASFGGLTAAMPILLGLYSDSAEQSDYHLDEFVIWNEVIDFTSNIALESGAGSIGTSRSSYVAAPNSVGYALGGGGDGGGSLGFNQFGL